METIASTYRILGLKNFLDLSNVLHYIEWNRKIEGVVKIQLSTHQKNQKYVVKLIIAVLNK